MFTKRSISWAVFGGMAFALMALMLAMPTPTLARIGVGVAINIAPPVLPVYAQPDCPGPNYIWTPGYWAYDYDLGDYYWVPGTWVLAPEADLLWTPGYWGWSNAGYVWHDGYWGRHVGFYGGIDYGFGYTGEGYDGGYWDHGSFRYNRAVNHVNENRIHNTYDQPVQHRATASRASFSGGHGGVNARPTAAEESAAREQHVQATSAQVQHREVASKDRGQFASVNHGRPAIAETARPGDFGHGAAAAPAAAARNASNAHRNAAVAAKQPGRNVPSNNRTARANQAPVESSSRNAGRNTAANRNAAVAPSEQPGRNVQNNNRTARASQPPVESSNRSAERNPVTNGNARFNAKPESNPRTFERPTESARANPAPRPAARPSAPRESAAARAPQPHAAPRQAAPQHAAPQAREQARASAPRGGEAPRGNERHDGK